jgi:UDP-N-acetyl-D-mannosaminuronic acid dehydrogenase
LRSRSNLQNHQRKIKLNLPFKKVAMIGLGYIGLPTAAVLASRGVSVLGVDINQHAVDTINGGGIHIIEPDLDIMVHEVVKSGLLRATTVPEAADAFIIAVPTPFKGDHEPDLSYVEAAAKSIAPFLARGNLVILESTSPVGTTEAMAQWLAEARPDLSFPQQKGEDADIQIAYCPERVLPGKVLTELIENDRVVGGMSGKCAERAAALYRIAVKGQCIITNARTAEMCKLTENSFRDVNIAFANELSLVCDKLDINVWELIKLANHHPRVNILQPGPGVGGHCIAVDPWFIVHSAPETARLIRTAREINDYKPHYVVERICQAASGVANPVIACFGLAFKPDIDDLRESPAVEVVHMLAAKGIGNLLVVEPNVEELPGTLKRAENLQLVSATEALAQANIVVMLVNHKSFYGINIGQLLGKQVIDTRGAWQ